MLLDTNILFSKVCFDSKGSDKFFNTLNKNDLKVVLTKYILNEAKRVIKNKYPTRAHKLTALLEEITYKLIEEPKDLTNFPEMRDEKDRPILAAAIYNDVDFLVTGDKDFLILRDIVKKPMILTMTEFIELYE